jgi:N-methylhydantoinase A
VERLAARGRGELDADGAEVRAGYDLRYAGQAFELTVQGHPSPDPDELRRAFDAAHEQRYGYSDPDAVLELVTVRVSVALPGGELAAPPTDERAEPRTRAAIFGGERVEATVLRGAFDDVRGPAVCELREATLVVPPGWSGAADEDGTIVLERR